MFRVGDQVVVAAVDESATKEGVEIGMTGEVVYVSDALFAIGVRIECLGGQRYLENWHLAFVSAAEI